MNWAFYLSGLVVPFGLVAIIFAPSTTNDPDRKVGFFGTLALGAGMIAFLIGLVLSKAY